VAGPAPWGPRRAALGAGLAAVASRGLHGCCSGGARGRCFDGCGWWCRELVWVVCCGWSVVPWWHGRPRSVCDCAPSVSWWCPWRQSCGGSSTAPWRRGWWCQPFPLLGDDDVGENPILLTLLGHGVGGAVGVIPFLKATSGISAAYLGSAVDRRRRRVLVYMVFRRWSLCEDVFFFCCFFSSFSFLRKRNHKKSRL
jgi:hypothetical protein